MILYCSLDTCFSILASREVVIKEDSLIHSFFYDKSERPLTRTKKEPFLCYKMLCLGGSFSGAEVSKTVTEMCDGRSKWDDIPYLRKMAKCGLIGRVTTRPGTKVGYIDLGFLCGKGLTQRIKGTLGITG